MSGAASLPCICAADRRPGTYVIGCERHIALELERGPIVSERRPRSVTVTYYRAEVLVSTPVLHDGAVWSHQDCVECEHLHETMAAADACAARLARATTLRLAVAS